MPSLVLRRCASTAARAPRARSRPSSRPRTAPAASSWSSPPAPARSQAAWKQVAPAAPRPPPLKVLYEDANLLVIDKPPDCSLQGQYGTDARLRWDAILQDVRKRTDLANINPIHRLDKSTTGTLILSKSPRSHKALSSQLARHEIARIYLAIVHGQIRPAYRGVIDAALRIDEDLVRLATEPIPTSSTSATTTPPKDLPTITNWECLASSPQGFSLLLLSPETGRKHQLRVHCSEVLRAPIVGDYKYAQGRVASEMGQQLDALIRKGGMYLHAWSMRLHVWDKHSGKRKTVGATAPLPYEFRRLCQKMGWEMPIETDVKWPEGLKEVSAE